MNANDESVLRLLDRALADPVLLQQLMADPFGTAHAAGVQVTTADVKRWLQLPDATDEELFAVLRNRLARFADTRGGPHPGSGASSV